MDDKQEGSRSFGVRFRPGAKRARRFGLGRRFLAAALFAGAAVLADPFPREATAQTTVAGVTDVTVQVDESGAMGITIPIAVTPGTAGMQPSLSLNYNSRSGNGPLGQGWSLGGLSTIQRCGRTMAQDNYTGGVEYNSGDRFCLDGQRLVNVSGTYGADGTEYRTEVDGFSKIVSHGTAGVGPQWWQVWTKAGQYMTYGNSANSRIEAQGQSDVRAWAVTRIQDTPGNRIDFTYIEEDGDFRIDRIDYGENPGEGTAHYAAVYFIYATRTDDLEGYLGGSAIETTKRLSKVRAQYGGSIVREYRISYAYVGETGRSQITDITECINADICLAPVTFESTAGNDGTPELRNITSLEIPNDYGRLAAGDFDGDGITDIMVGRVNQYGVKVAGFADRIWFGKATGNFSETTLSVASSMAGGYSSVVQGDFNGDGRTDLYLYKPDASGRKTGTSSDQVWLGQSDGSFQKITNSQNPVFAGWSMVAAGDFNGDSLLDFYTVRTDDFGLKSGVAYDYAFISDGDGTFTRKSIQTNEILSGERVMATGDFDGDRHTDLYVATSDGQGRKSGSSNDLIVYSFGDANFNRQASGNSLIDDYKFMPGGDFNGDGLVDLLAVQSDGSGRRIPGTVGTEYLWFNKGDGNFATVALTGNGHLESHAVVGTGDFNGDGLSDLIWMWIDAFGRKRACEDPVTGPGDSYTAGARVDKPETLWLSRGDGTFIEKNLSAAITNPYSTVWSQGDHNADGMMDLVMATVDDTRRRAAQSLWVTGSFCGFDHDAGSVGHHFDDEQSLLSLDQPQGQVTKVTTNLGAETDITYTTLNKAADYVTYDDATFPDMDFEGPLYVVEKVARDDGVGGDAQTTYRYYGARMDLEGRGFLGFRFIRSTDEQTDNYTITRYEQAFPFARRVQNSSSYRANTARMSRIINNHAFLSLNSGKTVFPYVETGYQDSFEPNDGPGNSYVKRVRTDLTHDTYGNATVVKTTTTGVNASTGLNENFVTEALNSYTNNTAKWHLGRLTQTTVTSTIPGGSNETRVSSFAYDSVTGLLTQETVEPGTTDELTTTYLHDGFGNVIETEVSGADISTRASTTQFEARGRFPWKDYNALGHQETKLFDLLVGKVDSLTGPNGITTTWEYDRFGRQAREVRADGTETNWEYLFCGGGIACPSGGVYAVRARHSVTATGFEYDSQKIEYFDKLNRVFRSETEGFDGTPVYADVIYDARGQAEAVSKPYFHGTAAGNIQWTISEFDASGRVTKVTQPNGGVATTDYDGLTNCGTDPLGHEACQYRNAIGQLVEVADHYGIAGDPRGGSVIYVYDPLGNLAETIDPNDKQTFMTYDIRGNKIAMTDPAMGSWTYDYNVLGELIAQTDAKGQAVTLLYDDLGRLVLRDEDEGITTWTYDSAPGAGIGKIHEESFVPDGAAWPDSHVKKTYGYDGLGRLEESTSSIEDEDFTISRGYDEAGRLDRLEYPSGFALEQLYTDTGFLAEVTDWTAGTVFWQAVTVNAEGQVTDELLGNGVTVENRFDPETSLPIYIRANNGTNFHNLRFNYDLVGNLTSRKDFWLGRDETFTYDALNRLTGSQLEDTTSSSSPPLFESDLTYDAVGNILTKDQIWQGASVNGVGLKTYLYDANGNVTQSVGGSTVAPYQRALEWSSFNKPVHIVNNATFDNLTFLYGPDRARVKQIVAESFDLTTMKYVEGLYEQHTRFNGPDKKIHYIRAAGTVAIYTQIGDGATPTSEKTRYILKDHLGSITALTDEAGDIAEQFSYDPWGKRRQADWSFTSLPVFASETPRGFTGHEMLDVVGLIHMNGRVYDPNIGRFLSPDPYVQIPESTQGFNRYSYVNNNPLSYSDPSGFFIKGLFAQVFTAVAVAFIAVIPAVGPILGGIIVAVASGFQTLSYGGSLGDFGVTVGVGLAQIGAGAGIGFAYGTGLKDAVKFLSTEHLVRIVASGVISGVGSGLRGGGFFSAAASAGLSAFAGPGIRANIDSRVGGTIAQAIVGGTASRLGGGKFANGAATAAVVYYAAWTPANDNVDATHQSDPRESQEAAGPPNRIGSISRFDWPPTARYWNTRGDLKAEAQIRANPQGGRGGANAARREAMRLEKIPTSQQPVSQSQNASGREYQYKVPKSGGGTQIKSVQQQTLDRSHTGKPHYEAGTVKTDPVTGAPRMNQYGRPKLQSDKSKVEY